MSRPLSGPTYSRPSASRSTRARRGPPTPGSTIARWTPTGMKPIVFARTSAPCRMDVAGMPWVMSMICDSGAMRFITPWQVPTKSSFNPKSLRNVMNTSGSVTPGSRRELLAASSRVSPAAAHRRPTCLSAEAYPTRPDPDERRRGLQRQWSRHHARSIFARAEGHASVPDFLRASSTSSEVSRCRRTSFAAMIAT